ncbi:Cytochrome P450 [Sesbania bispinosa]|nr:Cytochrome P450 [Sesbania bispinosa]
MALHLPSFLKQVSYDQNATLSMFLSFFVSMLLVIKLIRSRKLNLPPSPPKLPIIGNFHQLGTLPHRTFQTLSQKYGPLMFLHLGQLPLLLVSSADMAREVLQTNDVAFASRPHLTSAKALLYGCKDIAFASYGETWRQKRKLCVLEFLSMKRVQSIQFIREEEVGAFVDKIRKACFNDGTCSVNLSQMLIATTNNIICRCIFGRKYDVEGGRFAELGRKVMAQISDFSVGDLFPLLGWVDVLTGQIQKFKATNGALDDFFDQVITERKMTRRDFEKKKDFLDILLQLQESGMSEFELTQDDLKALVLCLLSSLLGSQYYGTLPKSVHGHLYLDPNLDRVG